MPDANTIVQHIMQQIHDAIRELHPAERYRVTKHLAHSIYDVAWSCRKEAKEARREERKGKSEQ